MVANTGTAATGINATKFDSANRVVYSFSFPPVQYVTVLAAVVDSQGSLLIGGSTNSTGFPVLNALLYPRLPTSGFGQRGFVAKLDPSGAKLLFSTLVGGDELDWHFYSWVTALAVDSADNIYLAGGTSSPTFPVSSNTFQKTGRNQSGSTRSAFLMKISSAGNALQFSTYLGGSNETTVPQALAVDSQGAATLAGSTSGADFPVTAGVYDCHCDPAQFNIFVSRFNADASALQWSTLLPGGFYDSAAVYGWGFLEGQRALGLAVDPQGNATIAGTTTNAGFPITPGALQDADLVIPIPGNGSVRSTGFLSTISRDGSTLLHSTYFGGTRASTLRGLAQDVDGGFWISGEAQSSDLQVPGGSLNLGTGYVAKLDSSLTRVLTYYGVPNGVAGQTLNVLMNQSLVLTGAANSVVTVPEAGPHGPSVLGIAGAAEPSASLHISPGELISLYGTQLGPDPGVSGIVDANGRISTAIDGFQVLVNGAPAPLLYAGPNQINLAVPFGVTQQADVAVQVMTPAGPSPIVTGFSVDPSEPQLFSVFMNQDGSINSQTNPAPRSSVVTVWATGGGAMDAGMVDGQISQAPFGRLVLQAQIGLGRLSPHDVAEVTYAGAAPGMLAGVVQINFRIPAQHSGYGTCHNSCAVSLTIGTRTSVQPDPVVWVVD